MAAINRGQMYNSAETNLLITYHFFAITRPVRIIRTHCSMEGGGEGWKQISRFSKRFPSAFVSRIRVECSLLEPFVRITLASRAATIDWRRSESNVEVTIPTESSRESFNRGKSSVITEEEREVHGEGGCTMVMRWCG